ncbi:hypothetical protein E5K76_02605 [Helicobacter pylori]|nr:hypothetical protein E5K76_02605 [Helicobacter pylori]
MIRGKTNPLNLDETNPKRNNQSQKYALTIKSFSNPHLMETEPFYFSSMNFYPYLENTPLNQYKEF